MNMKSLRAIYRRGTYEVDDDDALFRDAWLFGDFDGFHRCSYIITTDLPVKLV